MISILMAERHGEYYQQDTGLAGLFNYVVAVLMLIVTANQ